MPLVLTHGWPGSVFEFIEAIGPLSDPARFGGNLKHRRITEQHDDITTLILRYTSVGADVSVGAAQGV